MLATTAIGANANATVVDGATFKITDTKLYVFVVTLLAEDNIKVVKQLNEGFKRPVYWNRYKVIDIKIVEISAANAEKHISDRLDSSYQGVKRWFVLAYDNTAGCNEVSDDSFKKYFLRRVKIESCNIEIDGRSFYDQPINHLIKQYNEARKISAGKGDGYTTGCLSEFSYFEKNYRLIAADLIKQKALDADSRAIQQIIFTGTAGAAVMIYYILEQSKETILEFFKGTTKVF